VGGNAVYGRSSHGLSTPSTCSGTGLRSADSAAALTSSGVCQRVTPPVARVQPSVKRRVTPAPSGAHASRSARSASGAAQRLGCTYTNNPGTRCAMAASASAGGPNAVYTKAFMNGPRTAIAASKDFINAAGSVASTAAALIPAAASSRAPRATTVTGAPLRPSAIAAGPRIPVPPTTRT
jgi:hypothetical protein